MKTILRTLTLVLFSTLTLSTLMAVPAYPGWQTKTQADGTTVQVRLIGDEYYSFWETKEGKLAIEQADGLFTLTDQDRPSPEQIRARRQLAKSPMPKAIGTTPNLAPRGVVILVNFANCPMAEGHDSTLFDDMCNAVHCTTNVNDSIPFGSAAQYFADQSNGQYRPVFDIFGPVNLPHDVAYYGEQGEVDGKIVSDLYMADFVIDATIAADEAGCDFSQYDSDNDGLVDFVYFIYAGQGQAAGGSTETIWPHNWTLAAALWFQRTHCKENCTYYYNKDGSNNMLFLDGKMIHNYACSAELDLQKELGGIGTLCHEFGHVMGLPDFYDTNYGTNYLAGVCPIEWEIMDYGSYNGNSHCPPNYNPWSKYFFGWADPVNPGQETTDITLYPNGSEPYNVFQINASGEQEGVITPGVNYYIECRQQTGWDTYAPAQGMVIWRCDFDETAWKTNQPNNEAGNPRFTVVCSANIKGGSRNAAGNVFPNGDITSWADDNGNQLTDITLIDSLITCSFRYDTTTLAPRFTDWAYYDNGTSVTAFGAKDTTVVYWGVLFPKGSLTYDLLTKVAVFEHPQTNTQPIDISIFADGIFPVEENLIYTEKIDPSGEKGFHEITLSTPVSVDTDKNLWLILSEPGDPYPAHTSADTGEHNGRWFSKGNMTDWHEITKSDGSHYTCMVRAYFESQQEGIDSQVVQGEWSNGKFIQDGTLFIEKNGHIYTTIGQTVR